MGLRKCRLQNWCGDLAWLEVVTVEKNTAEHIWESFKSHTPPYLDMSVTERRTAVGLQDRQIRRKIPDLEAGEVVTNTRPLEQTGTYEDKQLGSVSHCCQPWPCRWPIKGDGTLCHGTAHTLSQGLSEAEEISLTRAREAVGSAAVLHQQCEPAG